MRHLFLYFEQGWRWVGVVYTVYADESGDSSRQRVFAVAGLIGSEDEWDSLKGVWAPRTGGTIFHAAECESDTGAYADTPHRENQRLYRDLTEAIANSKLLGFGAAISLEDHTSIFPTALPHQPYFMCFRYVVNKFAEIAATLVPQDRVKYIFDRNFEVEYNAAALYDYMLSLPDFRYREYMADEVGFATRADIGIQAADLVARETMKHFDNIIGPVKRPTRRSMDALARTHRFWFRFHTKEYLEDMKKQAIANTRPGHTIAEYDDWRRAANLQDTMENRLRYHRHLDARDSQK